MPTAVGVSVFVDGTSVSIYLVGNSPTRFAIGVSGKSGYGFSGFCLGAIC